MNREFVLRDNEVAINRPDGTVVIMNINALRELQGESDETKALKTKLAAANHMIAILQKQALDWQERHKNMSDDRNRLRNELESEQARHREISQTYVDKIKELTDKLDKANEQIQSQKRPVQMVLWGSTKVPKTIPSWLYVTSNGEVFFYGNEIEEKYNLPKGSVSSYFADKQKFLYPRDFRGVRAVDPVHGGFERLGVVRRFTNYIFENKNINKPDFSCLNASIECAKKYKDGEL